MKYITKKPNKLLNRANNGKYAWNFVQPSFIDLPAGTEVELTWQKTSVGLYYEITYRKDGVIFELSEKVNSINYNAKDT